ncbi:mCG147960 [Mus musculus]|nr:mCG147960 [Mus musculus]
MVTITVPRLPVVPSSFPLPISHLPKRPLSSDTHKAHVSHPLPGLLLDSLGIDGRVWRCCLGLFPAHPTCQGAATAFRSINNKPEMRGKKREVRAAA